MQISSWRGHGFEPHPGDQMFESSLFLMDFFGGDLSFYPQSLRFGLESIRRISKFTGRSVGLPGGYRITAQAQCFVVVHKTPGPGPEGFGLRRLARRPVFLKHFHTSTLKP